MWTGDNRWDRVEKAYDLMTPARGEFRADTAVVGLCRPLTLVMKTIFVKATVIRAEGRWMRRWEDGDTLIS